MADHLDAAAKIIPFDSLARVPGAYRFAGAEHGDVPFSLIVLDVEVGSEPVAMHRHPYVEAWVVQAGEATFRVGDSTIVVPAGHIVIGPANVPHGFRNSGGEELRMVAIHAAGRIETEFLESAGAD